jgi:hypothetical protein
MWNLFDQFRQTTIKLNSQNVIVLGGIIYKNGTVIPFEPWYNITTGESNLYPSTSGDYFIMLLDSNNNILSRSGFNISFENWLDDEDGNLTRIDTDSAPFIFSISYIPGTKYIELWDSNDTVVLSKMISIHSPVVTVDYPNGGETLVIGKKVTVTWKANDLDNDPLWYSVSYSTDGINWIPLAFHLTDLSYNWDTTGLQKGDNYKVRIMVTDGINTASDESDGGFSFTKAKTSNAPFHQFLDNFLTSHLNLFLILQKIIQRLPM